MEPFEGDLKNQVRCPLCKETLIDPKLAYCFHSFCKMCIKTKIQVDEGGNNVFKCPQCDSQTLLQDLNDVEDLQDSPLHLQLLQVLDFVENEKNCSVSADHPRALWQCIDCNQSLCKQCLSYHSKFAVTKKHRVVLLSELSNENIKTIMSKKQSVCKTHDDEDVELYCKDCDVLICQHCWKDNHYDHKVTSLEMVKADEKESLSKDLEKINKINTDTKGTKQQEQIALDIKVSGAEAKAKVKELTNTLVKILRDNEERLLNEIDKDLEKAERNLRIMRHTTQVQDYIKYFMENGTVSEMIDARHGEWYQHFTYDPFEENISGIEFKPNEELGEQVNTGLGLVRSSHKRVDSKMCSMFVEPHDMQAMQKAMLVIAVKSSEGKDMAASPEIAESVTTHFTPQGHVKKGDMKLVDNGEIAVEFTPSVCGKLTIDVQVHGNSIANSPLVMDVKPQEIKQVTGHSKLLDALNTGSKDFRGVSVNKTNDKIAVVDWKSHCVRVFNVAGDLLLTFGKGQLKYPDGIAFLNETDLIIADSHNHRLCVMNTTTGQLVNTFGHHGDGNGQFKCPCGVHVDDNDTIVVCDSSNNRVQVLTKDGGYLYQFKVPSPHSAVTHKGRFYVSDSDQSVVHVIDMYVLPNQPAIPFTLATIDGKNYPDGQLQWPFGLAIDNDEHLLVCDYSKCFIHKFRLDGRYVGRSSKQLAKNPRYIALLNDSQLICTTQKGIITLVNS